MRRNLAEVPYLAAVLTPPSRPQLVGGAARFGGDGRSLDEPPRLRRIRLGHERDAERGRNRTDLRRLRAACRDERRNLRLLGVREDARRGGIPQEPQPVPLQFRVRGRRDGPLLLQLAALRPRQRPLAQRGSDGGESSKCRYSV